MMILLIDALLLAIAGILTATVPRVVERRRARAAARAAVEIAEYGLVADGDLLGAHWVRGQVERVDVDIVNDASPGTTGAPRSGGRSTCVVRISTLLSDQIVCKLFDVDQIMGADPVVPRTQTGHQAFDEAFAIFLGPATRSVSASYRARPDEAQLLWAHEPILESLLELRLESLRVQGGSAELTFPAMEITDLVRAATAAAALEWAARGRALPALARGPRRVKPTYNYPNPWLPWGGGLIASFVGLPVAFVGPVRALDAEFVCGSGDWIRIIRTNDGMSLECAEHREASLAFHIAGSALAVGLAVVVVLLAFWCWRAATEPTRGS